MNNTYRDIAGSLGWPDAYTPFVRCVPVDSLTEALLDAYKKGAAEEREACAKIADERGSYVHAGMTIAEHHKVEEARRITAAIRSRTGGDYTFTDNVVVSSPYGMQLRAGDITAVGVVDTPNQHKLKPLGFVTLAELDEMSMKPNKTPQ